MEKLRLDEKEIKEGAALGALSYVFFLWILFFLFKKDNRFAHYHARQGLVIFIGEILCFFFPLIPLIGAVLYHLGELILIIFSLYGIYSSLTGKMCHIPIVTNIASKIVI